MIIMDPPHLEGYEWGNRIGGGSFSAVYKALSKVAPKSIVAIKCIHRGKKNVTDIAVSEIGLMKNLNHSNIVKFIDFHHDSKYIYIIMEYCSEGDLSKLIKEKYKLVESLVQMLMQQLALALKYLRQHSICHMDLKPQNILLTRNPNLTLKLADFGLSKILSDNNMEQSRFAGSLRYMAPEKLLHQKFDSKIDLWSVGIIMFECLVGRTPYGNANIKAIMEYMMQQQTMPIPSGVSISSLCEDLLYKLLRYSPNERIGFDEFFQHKFLNLNYLPCADNYDKVKQLLKDAISLEKEKQYSNALQKCRAAIGYLEGFLMIESDPDKKKHVVTKLKDYREFEKRLQNISVQPATSARSVTHTDPHSASSYELLKSNFRGTPQILTGIDIGVTAEMYFSEGKCAIALEKLKASLDILLPLLNTEPAGQRKELLYKHVQKWLQLAETLNASL